jgi:hypothetical protein
MEDGVRDWTPIQEREKTERHTDTYILNAKAIHAKLQSGDQQRPNDNLELSLSTFIATLKLPTSHEHRKLPKATTTRSKNIHTSRLHYIDHEALPTTKPTIYETFTTHKSLGRGLTYIQEATHKEDTYVKPSETIYTSYDVIGIQDHTHLHNQTTYIVIQ